MGKTFDFGKNWIVQYVMTGAGVPKKLELNNNKYFVIV